MVQQLNLDRDKVIKAFKEAVAWADQLTVVGGGGKE
jgi:hypothetical protein